MPSACRLHSRYRPEVEADRYIESLNPGRDIDFFILIEPGMGYLVDALRKYHSGGKAVILHADAALREYESRHPGVPAWYPDSGKTVQEFLESEIPEGASARIIEWRPSLSLYGKSCLDLVRESAEFIKRADASHRTTAAFGTRWVRNFFRNIMLLRTVLMYRPMETPVVVTGSGPGLEAVVPEIRAAGDGVFVLASSSSVPALVAGGVMPDMVISTDGGGWALMHLHACFRPPPGGGAIAPRMAFALSAALPSRCSEMHILPVSDGSLWQTLALNAVGIPSAIVPQRGTVTASALELALSMTAKSVFMAGMDLSVGDIRSHARPYGFDHLFFGTASRLRPVYSQAFDRSGLIRAGGSHDVYAAWFKSRLASWHGRVFSLGGGHRIFENRASLEGAVSATKAKHGPPHQEHFRVLKAEGFPTQRCRRALDALVSGLKDHRHAAALSGELAPLLFPSGSGSPAGSLAENLAGAMRDIAERYTRERR
ncbi:MAG: DUF115 domain-containing protein [Treponema sp.]|nr:DUF115 domain-containing protein [Treponema sp.]